MQFAIKIFKLILFIQNPLLFKSPTNHIPDIVIIIFYLSNKSYIYDKRISQTWFFIIGLTYFYWWKLIVFLKIPFNFTQKKLLWEHHLCKKAWQLNIFNIRYTNRGDSLLLPEKKFKITNNNFLVRIAEKWKFVLKIYIEIKYMIGYGRPGKPK